MKGVLFDRYTVRLLGLIIPIPIQFESLLSHDLRVIGKLTISLTLIILQFSVSSAFNKVLEIAYCFAISHDYCNILNLVCRDHFNCS